LLKEGIDTSCSGYDPYTLDLAKDSARIEDLRIINENNEKK
jgi:hypothetical protein